MSEDISAYIRTAVMVVIMAALVVAGLNISSIGLIVFHSYQEKFTDALNTSTNSAMYAVLNTEYVSAAMAYKFYLNNQGVFVDDPATSEIEGFTIVVDGLSRHDPQLLLNEYAGKNITINYTVNQEGEYKVTFTEVDY